MKLDYFTQKEVKRWGLILLVVINISALFSFAYSRFASQPDELPKNVQITGFQISDFLGDEIGFDPDQMQRYEELKQEFDQDAFEYRVQLHQTQNEMLQALAEEPADSAAIDQLAQQFGQLHGQFKKRTMRHFMNMKQLCKPGQEEKLEMVFKELGGRGPGMGRPGRGPGPHGRGPWWKKNNDQSN